ncbi:MAG: ThuA domain-containing protein [Caldilinea sp.]
MATLVFHVGGPSFHPVAEQAQQIAGWLGAAHECKIIDGAAAFDQLDECDLFVAMGLHWTGMDAEWAGSMVYHPLQAHQQVAFEEYVASGRPVIAHHGGIASYDDWPRYGELLGFTWVWGETTHSPLGEHTVHIEPVDHPVTAGVSDYTLFDELYYNVRVSPGVETQILATADWEGAARPMIIAAKGGRTAGAGRTIYLANGHDLRAFAAPALHRIWQSTVRYALEGA